MVRIAGSTDKRVKEPDYYTPQGEFKIDKDGSPLMLNTLMYKMCYYRFGEVYTGKHEGEGYEREKKGGGRDLREGGGERWEEDYNNPCYAEQGRPTGYDRVRNAEIGNKDFDLKYIEEVPPSLSVSSPPPPFLPFLSALSFFPSPSLADVSTRHTHPSTGSYEFTR